MNGVFDLGGTDGLGPVKTEENEPVFHEQWEKAAFAMFAPSFRAGLFGVDQFRHGIEKMDPAEYLMSPYYEHWIHTVQYYAEKTGLIDKAELDKRTQFYRENPDAPLPQREDPELMEFVEIAVKNGAPAHRESDKVAQFKVGDRVTIKSDSPLGHTRRARYVRGRDGEIVSAHGTYIYPDSAGNGGPDAPEHLYTVRFTAAELWGPDVADPNQSSYFDVWEPYLSPAV